jgi:hypothetical protein
MKLRGDDMTYTQVTDLMKNYGTEQNRKIYHNHGCDIDSYGVSIKNLKEIHNQIKNDTELGLMLFGSGNADLLYLSQWLVDVNDVSVGDINDVVELTSYYLILETVIPNVIIQDRFRSIQFIKNNLHSDSARYRQVAYSLYGLLVGYYDDVDLENIEKEIHYIESHIHQEDNRVKYAMNSFLISVGVYIEKYSDKVLAIGKRIGTIKVDMGKTACKVPSIETYIQKNRKRNKIGIKRKLKTK